MRLSDFDFDLPRGSIAQHPASPRDSARLLKVAADLTDHAVRDLPDLLQPGDLLVVNDTRVLPVRLAGRRGEIAVSVTLHSDLGNGQWAAFIRPGRRVREGDIVEFAPDFAASMAGRRPEGDFVLQFEEDLAALVGKLNRHGAMPLPPYIDRNSPRARDMEDYQTMFAANDGAIAAPTAGLHFTPALLDRLAARGVDCARVTLHVGVGTFLPVKVDDLRDHRMHAEFGVVSEGTAAAVNRAREAGGRIVAVGTTCVRLLESAAGEDGVVNAFRGDTDLFIKPGRRFRAVDVMMTNFHLPKSTLFVLVSAFAGRDRMLEAYRHAIAAGYRFYSYGDACLLYPEEAAA